jgi:hypothetical protein
MQLAFVPATAEPILTLLSGGFDGGGCGERRRLEKRTDLRGLNVCSIDPPGCTDIDDALHIRALDNGNYEVGVHIADVSHFIRSVHRRLTWPSTVLYLGFLVVLHARLV